MNEPTNDYLLLFRGEDWDQGLAPDELQVVLDKVMAWFDGLHKQGKVKGGQPLARSGRHVAGKGRVIADGPFAESKEAVGGYLVVKARDIDEATEVAQSCPTLDYGITIEVRPLLEECPCFKRARGRLLFANA
jgi:hypothetical protein